jgi:hypothetical protein
MISKAWKTTTYDKGFRGRMFGGLRTYMLGGHDPRDYRDGEREAREQDRKGRPRRDDQLQPVPRGRDVNGYKPSTGRPRHSAVK